MQWNKEPEWTELEDIYPEQVTEDTGMTDDAFNKFVENIQYAKNVSEIAKAASDHAKTLVDQLKEQVIEKMGTAVYLAGVAQNRIDFTSNPQEQIDNIYKQEIVYDKDSSDPAINLGYPNGILAGAEAITSINFSKYKYVIVDCLMSTRATAQCYIGKLQGAVSLSGGYIGFMTIDINTQYLKVTSAKEIYLYGTDQIAWYDKANIYKITKITGVL